MTQTSSLPLKFLYYLTGFPLVFLVIFAPESLEKGPQQAIWWSILGCILVTRVLLEKGKYQTGVLVSSWKTTVLALLSAGAVGLFLYFKLL
ncbi:hypothetical protein I5M27_01090 [Adhaeribacter sp. BT258]|uniref:Sulfate exporter family transporter n=1 Tax=Adhaeribacter terrigena TaxID=2793070 RepID=A0ABS1BXE5_9BACT|nr:hypothetical protein [Adhaeribacter terrigena]MBK0401557.1 hypothetical protein [Adhaeribacter terrigena]